MIQFHCFNSWDSLKGLLKEHEFEAYHGPGGSGSKESACNAGDPGSVPGLEKGMAIHSSTLAWRIPWTEEPGGLQSMRLQRAGLQLRYEHFNFHGPIEYRHFLFSWN